MGKAESLEEHFNSFLVGGGVGTVATVSSTAADAAAGDQRDENIRGINNIRLDVDELTRKTDSIIRLLRANGLIET